MWVKLGPGSGDKVYDGLPDLPRRIFLNEVQTLHGNFLLLSRSDRTHGVRRSSVRSRITLEGKTRSTKTLLSSTGSSPASERIASKIPHADSGHTHPRMGIAYREEYRQL